MSTRILRPSLLLRLSNVIFLQILFVFGAIAIILFTPFVPDDVSSQTELVKERLSVTTRRLGAVIDIEWSQQQPGFVTEGLKKKLYALLSADKWLTSAELFYTDTSGKQELVYSYRSPDGKSVELIQQPPAIALKTSHQQDIIGPLFAGEDYLEYYFPFYIGNKQPAVLAAAVNHNMIISNKGQVEYALLVIFLAATLISLLTVYLLIKQFRDPLTKLTQRLAKTAKGGIYYQLEAEGEGEAEQLTKAFNEVSAQLYDNRKELREYHSRLSEANRSLLTSKNFLSALIKHLPNCLIVASEDGQIMIFSREAMNVFGFADDREIVGKDIGALFAQSVEDLIARSTQNGQQRGTEALCWRQDKTMFPAFVTVAPIEIDQGARKAFLYIVSDITDSRSFQQMMIRLNKNYTKGEMAGDIAHDINNYLAVLMGNVELIPMLLKKKQTEKVERKLEQMKNTLDKIANYAGGLIDAEHDELFFEKVHLNQIIENVLAFLKPQKRYSGIEFETLLSTDTPAIDADAAKIQQLLVNLLSNSCDALTECEEKRIQIKTFSTSSVGEEFVRIEIRDDGPGVPEDKTEKLFQKRFTTKRKGHGIGLVTCRRIVEAHGGRIGYDASEGTMFYFELPVIPAAMKVPRSEQPVNEFSSI